LLGNRSCSNLPNYYNATAAGLAMKRGRRKGVLGEVTSSKSTYFICALYYITKISIGSWEIVILGVNRSVSKVIGQIVASLDEVLQGVPGRAGSDLPLGLLSYRSVDVEKQKGQQMLPLLFLVRKRTWQS